MGNREERREREKEREEKEREKERGSSWFFGRSSIVATLPRKTDSEMPEEDRPRPIFHLHNSHLPLQFEGNYKQASSTILDTRETPTGSATFVFSRKFSRARFRFRFALGGGVEERQRLPEFS